jgi:hypothetical protein
MYRRTGLLFEENGQISATFRPASAAENGLTITGKSDVFARCAQGRADRWIGTIFSRALTCTADKRIILFDLSDLTDGPIQ